MVPLRLVACTGPVSSRSGRRGPDPVTPPPPRSKVKKADIKRAIDHAQKLCFNFEDTPECRVAWDEVEELSAEFDRRAQVSDPLGPLRANELANREYDL
jgi:hypothetical protein